jgi:hypothetical protein
VSYTFSGESVTATIDGVSDTFDLSALPEGAELTAVETELPANPLVSARRGGGVLEVVLLRWYDDEDDEAVRWPQWEEV